MFNRKQQRQAMAEEGLKIAERLKALREPLPPARPLLDTLRKQLASKENELSKVRMDCDRLTNQVHVFRQEVLWLELNPEFDSLYARLSEKPDAPIRPSGQ